MKLIIVTQAVDTEDPILGFFVRWIEEFAKRVERIEVICLKEGKYALPENVRVHSLGKTENSKQNVASRIRYTWRFYILIWRLRRSYDAVFVHMNPEYVIFGGAFWRLWRKYVVLWYNHPQDDIKFKLGASLADLIFHTSPYAATARFEKVRRMPAGIDTEAFKPQLTARNRQSIYMQGRITPSKRVNIALEALRSIRETIPTATLTLVGPEDLVYGKELRERYAVLITSGAVVFAGPKKNDETPVLFSASGVSVNLAASGHFDKSVLESMACATPVVLSSQAFSGLVPSEWVVPENDSQALAEALIRLIELPEDAYANLGALERKAVVETQSLSELADSLVRELEAGMAS